MRYGAISDTHILAASLSANCVPASIAEMKLGDYDAFLKQRRSLMAEKIRACYEGL